MNVHRRVCVSAVLAVALATTSPSAGAGRPLGPAESLGAVLAHADSLHVTHRVDEAEAYLRPRLARARADGDSVDVLPLAARLGRLYASYGRPREGEPLLAEAASLATALGDTLAWCDALRWLGYAIEQQGRPEEARAVYDRLNALAVAAGDTRHEAWSLVGTAYGNVRDGRYEPAVRDYRRAADLFHALGDVQPEVWTLSGLGAALQAAGDFDAALACYRRVTVLARASAYEAVEAMAENDLGSLEYAIGDPGAALEHYRRALDIQTELSQRQDGVITGGNIADCLTELGRFDEADALLADLLATCAAGGFRDREPAVLVRLARLRRRQGRYREAANLSRRGLSGDEGVVDIGDRVEHLVGLARALAAQDSLEAAVEVLREGVRGWGDRTGGETAAQLRIELARAETAAGHPEAALSLLDPVQAATRAEGLSRRHLDALMLRADAERRLGDDAAALATLRAAVRAWEDVRDAPRDAYWREQRGSAGGEIAAALAATLVATGVDGTEGTAAAAIFDELQVFKARTMGERLGLGRLGAADRAPATAAGLADSVLGVDEALLDYYVGEDASLVFIVTREGVDFARLAPRSVLGARIRLLRDLVAHPPEAGSGAAVAAAAPGLADLVFGDLAERIRGHARIVVSPDDVLNLLPFAALVPGDVSWSRVPSATILAALRDPGRAHRRGTGVLAFASPRTRSGRPLPGAVGEVKALASRFGDVDVRIAGAGRETAPLWSADLDGYAVLHLASHARVDDQRPWSSGILVGPDAAGEAAVLKAEDVADAALSADLVVLSACGTGTGRVLSGEGVLGLSSAFLAAGARCVAATLWPVDDATTGLMMTAFYDELAGGATVSTALARAAARVREDPDLTSPFYWSGFVLIGDGDTVIADLSRRSRIPTGVAYGLLAAGLLVVGLLLRRRVRG